VPPLAIPHPVGSRTPSKQQHTLENAECGQRATERPCEMISRGSRHTGRGAAGEGGGRRLTCACRARAAPFAAVDGERRPPRGARLGAERQKEGALLNAKRGVGSRRGGHIVVVAPSPKLPEPRRRRPAAGPLRSGPRRTAADERSVELWAGGWGGAQPARLIVAVMRGLKVTETQKSCGGLAAELAGLICAERRPHRQPPISGSGQEKSSFRTARTQ